MTNNHSKKIILLNPPLTESNKEHLPVLSIGYIANTLERGGYEVKIIDSGIYGYNNSQTTEAVLSANPDAVGITCTTGSRLDAIEIIKGIKNKNKNIFIFGGGRHFHHVWFNSLEKIPGLDAIVRGEGELTTLELLDAYFSGRGFEEILGLAWRKNGKPIVNGDRPPIKNLDEIPWPAWHLYDLKRYSACVEGFGNIKSVGVISSRGCPNQCTFCANNSFWPVLRRRSPENFVDEVEFLHKQYGYQGFDFWDDTITIVREHILKICDEIIKRKLNIIWYARARVNTVDKEILLKMKQAGCRVIGFGIESGCARILKTIKKNITLQQINEAVYLCAKLGLITKAFFIHGLPGETKDDIIKTEELMLRLRDYGAKFKTPVHTMAVLAPVLYPGTEITAQAQREGIVAKDFDWSQPICIERNVKFGLDPSIPIYEKTDLSIEKIIEITKDFKKRPSVVLKSVYYHYRILGLKEFIIKTYQKLKS